MTQGHLDGFAPPVKDGSTWGRCPGCGVMGWRHPGRVCPGCGWSPGDDLAEGRRRRDVALNDLTTKRALWLTMARGAARSVAKARGWACSDDVHRICPVPEGMNPKIMGAVFRGPEWEPDGVVQTTRPVAHARPIRKWRLKT